MEMRFLHVSGGNPFISELVGVLAAAVAAEGVAVSLSGSDEDAADSVVDVVVPHEWYLNRGKGTWPSRRRRARTIGLVTEHPGTTWFELATLAVSELGASFALNLAGVAECRGRGLNTSHLQLGYTPEWDRWGGAKSARNVDITYLAQTEGRRNQVLAGFSGVLWQRRCALLIPPLEWGSRRHPDFLVGEDKWRHLSQSKIIVNLHRGGVADTEWPRLLEAISNGCVVVSEHCSDASPLVPGDHYLSADADRVADVALAILDDVERMERIRAAAYDFVRTHLPIRDAAHVLIDRATALAGRRLVPPRMFLPPVSPDTLLSAATGPAPAPSTNGGSDRVLLRRLATELLEVKRRQARLELLLQGETALDGVKEVFRTARTAGATPRVSVIMPLYNHEAEVTVALDSLAESEFRAFEVVLVDDASSDGSVDAVRDWFSAHPEVTGTLCAARLNHGPSWARNRAIERAEGDLLFLLDSDNAIYPPTLGRLVDALDANPDAALAYPIVALHTPSGPLSLMSHMAWRPELFVTGQNPVDTMAMVRKEVVDQLDGFAEDPRLMGLEDYDLWCRVADRGLEGVSVPELLGWYRRTPHSTVSIADIDRSEAMTLIASRAPRLFGSGPI